MGGHLSRCQKHRLQPLSVDQMTSIIYVLFSIFSQDVSGACPHPHVTLKTLQIDGAL